MNTTQPEALQLAECCEHGYPLSDEAIRAATELRRLHAYCQELESQLAQRFDAADVTTAAAQWFRDGVSSLTAQAADRAIEGCPELNMGNYDEVDVERLNDWAIRANDEIDRLHALAAGQATAAKGVAYAALPDEREAFESWLRSVWTAGYGCPKFDSGKYVHGEAQRFWECWQARTSHGQAPAGAAQAADSVQG